MAPATYAGATKARTSGSARGWTRENVIEAIREWVDAYGEPPRAADWNPSSAKWTGQQWRVERYRAGLGTYLNVLTAENNVLLQRRDAVDLASRALETQVGLAHALGGGYQAADQTAALSGKERSTTP